MNIFTAQPGIKAGIMRGRSGKQECCRGSLHQAPLQGLTEANLVNTFTATGRLATDAHLSSASGTSVSNFRLAREAGYGKHQKTLWIDCSLWGPKADALHQYLLKGKHVLISGELTTKEFKRKDGTLGTGFSLTVDRIEFIGSKKHSEDHQHDRFKIGQPGTPARGRTVGNELNSQQDPP